MYDEATDDKTASCIIKRLSSSKKEKLSSTERRLVIQKRFEVGVVDAFSEFVDQLGMPLPGGMPKRDHNDFVFDNKICPEHPMCALAQHHGMPTRLLDWTYNPTIAVFMAANREEPSSEGSLAVWAMDSRVLRQTNNWRIQTILRSTIGFLHAQEGLFTYHSLADDEFLCSGSWPRLQNNIDPIGLKKLVLPRSEASELLRLLLAERISRAHLMPTHDNVTKTLNATWRLAKLQNLSQ